MKAITLNKTKTMNLSVKGKTYATVAAICTALVLPQIFHIAGAFFGVQTALGEMLLPMHLPIILAAFIAGPIAGVFAGLIAPIVSFAVTGMPVAFMVPVITVELMGYGLVAGLLKDKNMPMLVKVLFTQIGGRVLRAGVVLFLVFVIGQTKLTAGAAYMNIKTGVIGIALQLVFVPVIMVCVNKMMDKE